MYIYKVLQNWIDSAYFGKRVVNVGQFYILTDSANFMD